ncbi:gliding motility-associated C-terminal domain-containing protein [Spirochaetia bacterium 38H-sp]|uniref:Gliding motility-associated C-terminal domain-containing protein n=1 Tax=Rarispira pelagica TaxID=3141764 RepID=A0ABU9UBN2_9SPIR
MKKIIIITLMLVLSFTIWAGGGGEKQAPSISLGDEDTVYISPAVSEGVQDTVTIPLTVTATTILRSYRIVIQDEQGNIVWTAENEPLPEPGFFDGILIALGFKKKDAVTIPSSIDWDGKDSSGNNVPDGTYTCNVTVTDDIEQTSTSSLTIVVDNTPPSAEIRLSDTIFSPNGDGKNDYITAYMSGTEEEEWTITVTNEIKQDVFTYRLENAAPSTLTWDGTMEDGSIIPDGTYTVTLSATDAAGNSFSVTSQEVTVDASSKLFTVIAEPAAISPNGDGNNDYTVISVAERSQGTITELEVTVTDEKGNVIYHDKTPEFMESVIFNGIIGGDILPDGKYTFDISATYETGTVAESSFELLVDTKPPVVLLNYGYKKFSPNGDGFRDSFVVEQAAEEDLTWTSEIRSKEGGLIYSKTWRDGTSDFIWDGRTAEGGEAPEGFYTYKVYARDDAGNLGIAEINDIELTYSLPEIKIITEHPGFSPNGDGIRDDLTVILDGDSDLPVDSAEILVTAPDGTQYTISSKDFDIETLSLPFVFSTKQLNLPPLPDGEYMLDASVRYGDKMITAKSSVWVDTVPPVASLSIEPVPFSPDGDSRDEKVALIPEVQDNTGIESWTLVVTNKNRSKDFSGNGDVPSSIEWDGRFDNDDMVEQAHDYPSVLTVTDYGGNIAKVSAYVVTDVFVVIKNNDAYISVPDIHFAPFTADYTNKVPADIRKENLETLDAVAAMLKKFPEYHVVLEGHAVSLLWYNRERATVEQKEVLVPLSRARAQAVRKALIERGIDASRLKIAGLGGERPIVPFSDTKKRWVNRRVEFMLEEKSKK